VTVKLTRGNGNAQWQACRTTDTGPTLVFFRCPLCTGIGAIASPVTADGMVTTLVSCSLGNCTFSYQVYLEGWAEMNRSAELPPVLILVGPQSAALRRDDEGGGTGGITAVNGGA
jgi:hypothetical protein